MQLHRVVRTSCFAILVAGFVAGAALPAGAQPASWDAAKVGAIAAQLPPAAGAWEQATRRLQDTIGSGTAQEVESIAMKARALHEMCNRFAEHVAKGGGLEKTRDEYRSMKEVQDDTNELAPRANLDAPAQAAWSKLDGLLKQLAPYYAGGM